MTRDPACEVVYSRYYQNKCKKSFRMSLGSDTTELTLFGGSIIIYYVVVYFSVNNISTINWRAE